MLDQASQYGVKVMFTLANNWKTFDSKYNVRPSPDSCCLKSVLPAASSPGSITPHTSPCQTLALSARQLMLSIQVHDDCS